MHKRVTSPGDHGSMYNNRIRARPPETPKIRLPKGHLKPLEEGTFEAKHFDSDQQHRCRNAIQSAEFKDAVWPWWCRLKRDKSGTALTRDSYLLISCRIFKILLGPSKINDQKLVQAAELDWQIDMLMDDPTSEIMAQRQFYRSMFLIADVWASTNELDDLCAFLGVLYVQLQQTVGFHRSRRNSDENYGIYDNHLQKSMSSVHSSLSVRSLVLPINHNENDSNRWPNVDRGRSYSFGLRCPMPQADVSSYPGPNAYLPKFESISSPYAKGKGYPGAKGASFSGGPKSWTRSMAFAAMSGHAGILNPPHYSGWPTPRKDDTEMQPPSFWRPTSTKAPERTKTQKYYDNRVEEKTVLGLQKRNIAHEKLLLKYKKDHYLNFYDIQLPFVK